MDKKNKYGDVIEVGQTVYFASGVDTMTCWQDAGIVDGPDWTVKSFPEKSRLSVIVTSGERSQICFLDDIRPVAVRSKRVDGRRKHAARSRLAKQRVAIRARKIKRGKRDHIGR